jgi:hypothetical protein
LYAIHGIKERLGTKEVGRSFSDFQDMKYSNPDRWSELKTMYRQTNSLDNSGGSGIMKNIEKVGTAVQDVHYIGKLDKEIYSCVTEDIVADDIIITDERVQHIKDRHPNDYERYYGYMRDAVLNPEYIIESNKPKTALVLKSFYDKRTDLQFKIVVRLITVSDDSNLKNSVITFMKINEKEWNRLIKNKKILYKSE